MQEPNCFHSLNTNYPVFDAEAYFTQVYKKFQPQIHIKLRMATGSQTIADELSQDIFIALWMNEKLKNIQNIEAYLYVMTQRFINNHYKEISRKKEQIDTANIIDMPANECIYTTYEYKTFRTFLKSAVENLPNQQRRCFHLKHECGYKGWQIAKILNITVPVVRRHLKLGMKKINNFLETQELK